MNNSVKTAKDTGTFSVCWRDSNFTRSMRLFTSTDMEVLTMVRAQSPISNRLLWDLQQQWAALCNQAELTFWFMYCMQMRRSVRISHRIIPRKLMLYKTECWTMNYINYKNPEGCQKRVCVCSIQDSRPNYHRSHAAGCLVQPIWVCTDGISQTDKRRLEQEFCECSLEESDELQWHTVCKDYTSLSAMSSIAKLNIVRCSRGHHLQGREGKLLGSCLFAVFRRDVGT